MAIRLDPRRVGLLKELAAQAGLRPGELVTQWVEERLDAARAGTGPAPARAAGGVSGGALEALSKRVDELARRVEELSSPAARRHEPAAEATGAVGESPGEPIAASPESPGVESAQDEPRESGRRRRAAATKTARPRAARRTANAGEPRVALHDEISAVIGESGPMTAAEIAQAIADRGRYSAPRSAKPLDAAMVNGRVSNPTYRSRFTRQDGKIGLASG